jgi:hypothetical protein
VLPLTKIEKLADFAVLKFVTTPAYVPVTRAFGGKSINPERVRALERADARVAAGTAKFRF